MKKLFAMALIAVSITSASAFASPASLKRTAVSLLESLTESAYGTRSVCIFGNQVYGIQPGPHWSIRSELASGTLDDFPQKLSKSTAEAYTMDFPKGPEDWGRFEVLKAIGGVTYYATSGKRNNLNADICVFESKMVLE